MQWLSNVLVLGSLKVICIQSPLSRVFELLGGPLHSRQYFSPSWEQVWAPWSWFIRHWVNLSANRSGHQLSTPQPPFEGPPASWPVSWHCPQMDHSAASPGVSVRPLAVQCQRAIQNPTPPCTLCPRAAEAGAPPGTRREDREETVLCSRTVPGRLPSLLPASPKRHRRAGDGARQGQ